MKCFTLVGVLSETREIYKEVEGEVFYRSTLTINKKEFSIIGSEYIMKKPGKVSVTGFVAKEEREDSRLCLYISCKNMVTVEDSKPDSDGVIIGGKVCFVKEMAVQDKDGLEVLVFDVRYFSYDNKQNIVRCVAKGKLARELADLEKFSIIELSGTLNKHKEQIEVEVSKVDYRESESNSK